MKNAEKNPLGKKWLMNPFCNAGRGNKRPDDFEPQFHDIVDFSMLVAPMPDPANNREIYEQFEERNGFSLFIYEWVVDDKYVAPERLYVSKEIREREACRYNPAPRGPRDPYLDALRGRRRAGPGGI